MQLKLLVVLEIGVSTLKLGEYLARACGGDGESGGRIVLFVQRPSLPPWVEAGDSRDVVTERQQYEAEASGQLTKCLDEVRRYLVEHGVREEAITEEVTDASDQVVPEILAAAREHGCDTIVLVRHHKSIMRELFEGDFEEKLLRRPIGLTLWLVD